MTPARGLPAPTLGAAVLLVALLVAACTDGGGPPATPDATPDARTTASEDTAADPPTPAPAPSIVLADGARVDVEDALLDAAALWIAEESGLSEMLQSELALQSATTGRDVVHLRFVQQHDDVTVRGAQLIVHVRTRGEVIGASQSLTTTLPGEGTDEELTTAEATALAVEAVPGADADSARVQATWLEDGDRLRLGWDVRLTTQDPPSGFSVVVDATDGRIISIDRLAADGRSPTSRAPADATDDASAQVAQVQVARADVAQANACNAPAPPSACIFVVDPIYASGNPRIDIDDANAILVGVPLPNLIDPSSPDLVGRYAAIAPEVAPLFADADGIWGADGRGRGDGTFEAGMTYYWIDYAQQIVQELGFRHHADDPVEFVPIEPAFPDNAFYLFTEDRIHMGQGADGVNEAEDAQGIIHEYGHALLQSAVPDIITAEGGAFHESIGDLVSVFTTLEFRTGDVGCLFHWAERGACIRRVDTDLVYPQDLRFEVHLDGELFSGAVWDVFTAVLDRETGLTPSDCQVRPANPCDPVRDEVYATLLGSLNFLTPTLTLDDAATAFAVSDQTFFAGRNATEIRRAFADHGLSANGTPAMMIEGLADFQRSNAEAAVKILHPFRGDLTLRLDVVDAAGAGLCSDTLLAPDPEDDADNVTGRFDLVDTECADLLPPTPDRVWQLTVVDDGPLDQGTVFQFAISHEGQRFLAEGLPAVIPDVDPAGVTVRVTGAGS